MYDARDRLGIPLTLPTLMRSQRDSSSHLPGSSTVSTTTAATRLTAREAREARAEREGTRRTENGRKKGGESVDWRRGMYFVVQFDKKLIVFLQGQKHHVEVRKIVTVLFSVLLWTLS